MAQLPNPHADKPYDRYYNRAIPDGKGGMKEVPEYGVRIVDGLEEIVHLDSGQSNMKYHQPELVFNPDGCEHVFFITDIRKREIECKLCFMPTSFHAAGNFVEENGKAYIILKHKKYVIEV